MHRGRAIGRPIVWGYLLHIDDRKCCSNQTVWPIDNNKRNITCTMRPYLSKGRKNEASTALLPYNLLSHYTKC